MSDLSPAIMSVSYFGPVQYYTKFLQHEIVVEKHEHYTKQSYRNRCEIYGANGKQSLVIPVVHDHGKKTLITDVKIDYDTNWQINHWRSIESAYRSAPFYEYYIDEFEVFFNKKYTFLFDLDMDILNVTLNTLNIVQVMSFNSEYERHFLGYDFRNAIHPKKRMRKEDPGFIPKKYAQVFSEKTDFLNNLSILDLIFNEGPEAKSILMQSVGIY